MKTLIQLSSILLLIFVGSSTYAFRPIRTLPDSDIALSGYDAVIYYAEKKAVKGFPSYKYKWKDAHWYFSNRTNLELFKMHPEMFIPAFGGYCVFGVASGQTVAEVDPKNFVVYKGRVYFFHDPELLLKWNENQDAFIEKAEKSWEKLIEQGRIAQDQG